jgi:L-amino acid N-acyltransferase YncA
MSCNIAPMERGLWDRVREIYLEGIATGNATFETTAPDWERWDSGHHAHPRLVAIAEDGDVTGWAALSPVSARHVYRGVAEVSIYIAANARGQGVGFALLSAIVKASESAGFWTLQAGIFQENEVSIRLHERCGFRVVGVRERIGFLAGRWRDTVWMERRSAAV